MGQRHVAHILERRSCAGSGRSLQGSLCQAGVRLTPRTSDPMATQMTEPRQMPVNPAPGPIVCKAKVRRDARRRRQAAARFERHPQQSPTGRRRMDRRRARSPGKRRRRAQRRRHQAVAATPRLLRRREHPVGEGTARSGGIEIWVQGTAGLDRTIVRHHATPARASASAARRPSASGVCWAYRRVGIVELWPR